jgi:signal transduction histidine kinase
VFRSARLTLTIVYSTALALVMAGFSVALYIALSASLAGRLDVSANVSPHVESLVLDAQLARARIALLAIGIAGWVVVATASWVIAGRTLGPLALTLQKQREFTAHASHELRTPLTVIRGEIDVTQARDRSSEEYRTTLMLVEDEAEHLEGVLNDLLSLARMESGQEPAQRVKGTLDSEVDEVLAPFRDGLRRQGIRVRTAISLEIEARLDWRRFRLLLTNLVDNARKHSRREGCITIDAQQHGRYVEISVFNTGPHVSDNDLPNLFLPFYRGSGEVPYEGSGLGLALCVWIARLHQGSIVAHNVRGGVNFVVRLRRD